MIDRISEIDLLPGHGRAEVDEQVGARRAIERSRGLLVALSPATHEARTVFGTEVVLSGGPGINGDGQAESPLVIDEPRGLPVPTPPNEGEQAEKRHEIDRVAGLLASLSWSWRDIQQARLAAEQRGLTLVRVQHDMLLPLVAELRKVEDHYAEEVKRELRRQPIWPWLSQFPGLGGVHVARLVALIGDPHRFPGQPCTEGHIAPARYSAGDPCPRQSRPDADGVVKACAGTMLEPRPHTGKRSLWHFLGLHVVDGKSPRKAKGQKADWNPLGRTVCLQPGGIAEQIVRHRVPVYRDIYDAAKERLQRERGAEARRVVEESAGTALPDGPDADSVSVIEMLSGLRPIAIETQGVELGVEIDASRGSLRPIEIEGIARKVAVKTFVKDLLAAWKALG